LITENLHGGGSLFIYKEKLPENHQKAIPFIKNGSKPKPIRNTQERIFQVTVSSSRSVLTTFIYVKLREMRVS